jgi:glycosyltransferase involved in cell wall biosynthesis
MRLLFCCEFYFPSVGGVQEVMRQIAERLVRRGHDVTVATTRLSNRNFFAHNGVKIVEFGVSGNLVRGIDGEIERYREFVRSFDCDAIMIKAAQQWTFDAIWPDLDNISARKVLIPCGFSGLFEPHYASYFQELPAILRKFDHLIFYAQHYRDVNFARDHKLGPLSVLANGACEIEFGVEKDRHFRRTHGIPEDSVVLLTVGSLTGVKGHKELLEAFVRLKNSCRHVTLILNGNSPPKPQVVVGRPSPVAPVQRVAPNETVPAPHLGQRMSRVYKLEGMAGLFDRVRHHRQRLRRELVDVLSKWVGVPVKIHRVLREEGLQGIRLRAMHRLVPRLGRSKLLRYMPASIRALSDPMAFWIEEAKRNPAEKLLILSDYPREELVQAYMAADLFVFASNIEYSPLVLFESVAAATPFLSVPVGNAEEIAKWTGGGIICPANKDERGYTRADPKVLAAEIAKAIEDPAALAALGQSGHLAWKNSYTWDAIATKYEAILRTNPVNKSRDAQVCEPV